MAAVKATGQDQINQSSFGCSCNALGTVVQTLHNFPNDITSGAWSAEYREGHAKLLAALDAECKLWKQGGNYCPGSAVFCLLTKNQLEAKKVLEANGFEELGRTISSHIWPHDMEDFRRKLDANEVIYLMGKGWYHRPVEQENTNAD